LEDLEDELPTYSDIEAQDEPYSRTIAHMKKLLQKKSAPMQKLIDLQENRTLLSEELFDFQIKHGILAKSIG